MGFVIVFIVSLGSFFGFGSPQVVGQQLVQPTSFTVQSPCQLSPQLCDADLDRIQQFFDLCPGTILGNQVDAHGCATYQIDSDGDGFCNANLLSDRCNGFDFCPTLPGPLNGCGQFGQSFGLNPFGNPFGGNPFVFNQLGGPVF